jgi:hypothetical protein
MMSKQAMASATDDFQFPARHGADTERARRAAALFLQQLPGSEKVQLTEADRQRHGQALLVGDPPADRLIAWMRSTDMAAGWKQVNMAIERGVAAVPDASAELREFFQLVDTRPAWVDDALLIEGARACNMGGLASMRALLVTGLMAGYQLAAINETLIATGALEKGASRRIAETTKWWADVTEPGGMARMGAGFKSTVHVRLIHAMVRSHVSQKPDWNANDLGVPVCQNDMQITYLGFSVIYLLSMKLVGVWLTAREREAVMHLWRYIAWVNGVQDELLHEMQQGERSGMVNFYKNMQFQRMSDRNSARLAVSLADEPLARKYPSMPWLMGRYNRSLQLSIARVCMSTEALRDLGLKTPLVPWYPLLMLSVNLPMHSLVRLLPGGRNWLISRGRRQQSSYLPILFGEEAQKLRNIGAVKVHGSH